jgi:iron transport multicopper oxidase
VIPDELVLNNTIQLVYNASASPAASVQIDAAPVLDDTKFAPVLKREMIGKTVEFRLDAYFDVSSSLPIAVSGADCADIR